MHTNIKEMMKNILLIMFPVLLFACKAKKDTTDYAVQGYEKATIIKYEVESCGYIIQLENENKLMPDKLDESFKKDQLKVWVKYEILKKQPMSTCMAGKAVKMLDIKRQ